MYMYMYIYIYIYVYVILLTCSWVDPVNINYWGSHQLTIHADHLNNYCEGEFYILTWLGHRVPRYLIQHYSGHFCDGVFDKFNIYIIGL